jgi:hypothetical protein
MAEQMPMHSGLDGGASQSLNTPRRRQGVHMIYSVDRRREKVEQLSWSL